MVAWINYWLLLFSSILFLLFYVLSVSPAKREKTLGANAYRRCYFDRLISGGFEFIVIANFVIYIFYPLPTFVPDQFPWPWWVSLLVALLIGIPATLLMVIGIRDAGEEAIKPKKEHTMYSGIYTKFRHPQAVGEVFLFPAIAVLLHSPFLTIFSLIFFPIFLLLCHAEEQDLLLRYGDAYAEYCRKTGAFWPKKSGKGYAHKIEE